MIRRRATAVALAAGLLAACQSGPSATVAGATEPGGVRGASPSADVLPSLGPPPSPTPPDSSSPVVVDATLLAFLPQDVNGSAVTESIDEATNAISNPDLPKIASAVDAAVAVDGGHSNLVYALVVRLLPGKLTDAIYRQWRDSYDQGACADAGGIVGRAETTIDSRTVSITSCVQGIRVYHVWLNEPGILISAWAIGDGKFGELLMDNLRLPTATPS